MHERTALRRALQSGPGIYFIGLIAGLALTFAVAQEMLFAFFYGVAAVGWIAGILLPGRLRPWPMVIGALPLIPMSLLAALFLFPLYVPILGVLLAGAILSFDQIEVSAGGTGNDLRHTPISAQLIARIGSYIVPLVLGIAGVVLILLGVSSSIDWKIEGLGVSSELQTSALGVVCTVVGAMVAAANRLYLHGEQER